MRARIWGLCWWMVLTLSSVRAAEPYGLDSRALVAPYLYNKLPPVLPEAAEWRVVNAFPNLTFPNLISFVAEPRGNRFFAFCREGKIYSFENNSTTTNKTLFLDLSRRTQGWDDCGLLGMALHPQFGQLGSTNSGFFFVFYNYSPNPTNERPGEKATPTFDRLSRFTVLAGSSVADPNSELVLIDQYDQHVWHNGGGMFFSPDDGFLYLSLGDEGGVNAQYGNTQLINKRLFSGVIRMDVDRNPTRSHPIRRQPRTDSESQRSRTANYYIPNDNPFLDSNGSVLEEFWCIGLRNPHRLTYDPSTKTIWAGDVGGEIWEEINLIEKAGNYGWGYLEGDVPGPLPKPANLVGVEKPPLYQYPHKNGDNCVIGGYVYRGREHTAKLGGKYIFGDNGSGQIWALTLNSNSPPTVTNLCSVPAAAYRGLASFGVDNAGEIYLCTIDTNSVIYKLAPIQRSGFPPPPLLSQTGAFRDTRALKPTPGLIPYEVNSPLWSDSAIKLRWLALPYSGAADPANRLVGFSRASEWSFPAGTVFVKHFELAIDESDPTVRKRLETRFLVRDTNDFVYGITYKWRPDHSDADLLDRAVTEEVTIKASAPVGRFASSLDIGGPLPGSTLFDASNDSYTLAASGADIWDTSDQFRFVYQRLTGDFDIKTHVESLASRNPYTKAGLMARETLGPDSRHVLVLVFAESAARPTEVGDFELSYRDTVGGPTRSVHALDSIPRANFPNAWMRLKRAGNDFAAYAANDGSSWTAIGTNTLALPKTVYFGMAVTSQNPTAATTARFRDFANNIGHAHYYPSRQDCLTCHNKGAGQVLGVRAHQLNGPFHYPETGRVDNQLRTWNHLGLFQPSFDEAEIAGFPRLVAVTNTTASLQERARSYLAANCAQCHRPNGVVRANFDARYETALELQGLINGVLTDTLNDPRAKVLAPASATNSMLLRRINSVDAIKMPPLARNLVDASAVQTFVDWINSLPHVATYSGLRAEYYGRKDLTNLRLTRVDDVINFNWGPGSPDPRIETDNFSVRWTGQIEPHFSESYTFYATADDGIRMWLDGALVIDGWKPQAATEYKATVGLAAGRKYGLRVEYFEDTGDALARLEWSSASQPREVVSLSQLFGPLTGFLDSDIGAVGIAGFATYTNQSVAITASGPDIGGYADAFHFVYRTLDGDGEIVARVMSFPPKSDFLAKAGVMIRESLGTDSPYAFTAITPESGSLFLQRRISGGPTFETARSVPAFASYWVKIARSGDTFAGSISPDGVLWSVIGSETIAMNPSAYVGLALTSHDDQNLIRAGYSDVNITPKFTAPRLRLEPLGNGQMRLLIVGPSAGNYDLQSTANFRDWQTLTTFLKTNGTIQFIDAKSTNYFQRFYRAVGTP